MESGDTSLKTLQEVFTYINQLSNPETRENALLELSKKRESVGDLALMLWYSFGTIAGMQIHFAGSLRILIFYFVFLISLATRNCQHLSLNHSSNIDRTAIESRLQCLSSLTKRRLTSRDSFSISSSSHPTLPISILAHIVKDETI